MKRLLCLSLVLALASCGEDSSNEPPILIPGDPPPEAAEFEWFSPAPQGNPLISVWAARDVVVAVGDVGTVVRNDQGGGWMNHFIEGYAANMLDVWACSGDDIVATSWYGAIFEYDGADWSVWSNNATSGGAVFGVPTDVSMIDYIVYAVGGPGFVASRQQGVWTQMATPFNARLRAVWADSPNDVFVAGEDGFIAHFDGNLWTVMSSGTNEYLDGLWGFGPNDVFASGNGPTVLHYDGTQWTPMAVPVSGDVRDVWGRANNDLFIATRDGEVARYDGSTWTIEMIPGIFLWGLSGNLTTTYAVGNIGEIYERQSNGVWSRASVGPTADITDVWPLSKDEIWATVENGDLVHFNNGTMSAISMGPNARLTGLWGEDLASLHIVGQSPLGGFGKIWRYDGGAMTEVYSADNPGFEHIWGSAPDDIFAGSKASGDIVHFDGTSWSEVFQSSASHYDMWGSGPNDVYVAGCYVAPDRYAVIRHFNGIAWSTTEFNDVDHFRGVWGRSENDIYAAGDFALYHFDGVDWTPIDINGELQLLCVGGSVTGPAFVGSTGGWLMQIGEQGLVSAISNHRGIHKRIRASADGTVWAVGRDGMIIRHIPKTP